MNQILYEIWNKFLLPNISNFSDPYTLRQYQLYLNHASRFPFFYGTYEDGKYKDTSNYIKDEPISYVINN